MEEIEITIIGAGVIGLAIAFELSKVHKDIFILEKNLSFGQETSSRNSEVIHAGIYYPKDSLKAKTCIEGKQLLYEFCRKNNISCRNIGKLIVAIDKNEIGGLESLFKSGRNNGVEDLVLLNRDGIKQIEPHIEAEAAIYSPSTGILDSHRFMDTLISEFKSRNAQIAYNTEVVGIDKVKGGFNIYVEDSQKRGLSFFTRILINCSGLNSDKVARIAGIDKEDYRLKYCKGDYFRVSEAKARYINRLIYPVPKKDRAGLGIHATPDLAGSLRLGPDDEYIEKIDYNIDGSKQKIFYESVKYFLPFIEKEDLKPDTSGIRPKLQGPQEDFRDFLIKDESDCGLAGFVNLIGIESPGLTSALSIAKLVRRMVENFMNS